MARKHKHPEHVNHERWLVSYADFITLLFATFTALYALSKADAAKAKSMAESMRVQFGASTNSLIPKAVLDYMGIPSDVAVPQQARRTPVRPTKNASKSELENTKNTLESFLITQKLMGKVRIELQHRGLVVSLTEAGFFQSGQADVIEESRAILSEIASQLKDFANPIRVEGHTDTLPISSRTYPSNWELSSTRASQVARLLSTNYGIWPSRLSVAGFAEFKPLVSNSTPEGRARNRRVDIVLLSNDPTDATPVENEPESPQPSTWSDPNHSSDEAVTIP